MARRGLAFLIVALLLIGSSGAGRAAGHNLALIVALDYNWSPGNGLRFTRTDAERFRRFLAVPDSQAILLTDTKDAPAANRATKANILQAVKTLAAKAGPEDTFWFYFSGHGKFVRSDDTSYLIPADVTRLDETSGLSVRELRALLTDPTVCKARTRILVLDACESGSSRRWVEAAAPEPAYRSLEGVVTFAAARPDRSAFETEKAPIHGGLFTYYLCAGLAGAAATVDKPIVTLEGLQQYVVREVNGACTRLGKTPQEPIFLASGSDWQNVAVGIYRPDALAQFDTAGVSQIKPDGIEERPPLEPGMIVTLAADSKGVDESALGHLKEELIKMGVPLLSEETIAPFLDVLRDPKQTTAALAEAERYNARLLLRVRIISNLKPSAFDSSLTSGTLEMQADLLDVYGKVKVSEIVRAQARPNGQADKALDDALVKATALLLDRLKGKLPLKAGAETAP